MKLQTFCLSSTLGLVLGASVAPLYAATGGTPGVVAHSVATSKASTARVGERVNGLPNVDRFGLDLRSAKALAPIPQAGFEGRPQSALFDRQLGLPTFLWARGDAQPVAVGALTTREQLIARARAQLRTEASLLKLSEEMIANAKVTDAQYNGSGAAVVRFKQQINGLEVFSRRLNVMLDRAGKPVAVSGYFATGLDAASLAGPAFSRSPAQAIAAAASSLGLGKALSTSLIQPTAKALSPQSGSFQWFKVPALTGGNQIWQRMPRSKAIYYPRGNNTVEPAYYVELFSLNKNDGAQSGYGLVVSAASDQILHRRNLVSDAAPFTYTVFADGADNNFHPWDSPLGNAYAPFPADANPAVKLPRIPTVETAPKVTLVATSGLEDSHPWLADGATTTKGNNAEACLDLFDPSVVAGLIQVPLLNRCDALLGDLYPSTTSANTFDYAIAPNEDPSHENAQSAAVVNLFYMGNWLHDLWYVHGFNEEAGNAQADNYGLGGVDGDPLFLQGQDGSGRNNANMSTPADGSSPSMQQYLFDGPPNGFVKQASPTELDYVFSVGTFTPQNYDVSATDVVLADDGIGEPTDGCGIANPIPDPTGLGLLPSNLPPPPDLSLYGKIVLVDRGTCAFTTKARWAQISGAAGIVIVNNTGGEPIPMANSDLPIDLPLPPLPEPLPPLPTNTDFTYTIPTVMIRMADGAAIKEQLAAGTPVQLALRREPSIDIDGTMDNQIIAHEFFHYVHHRLTNSSNQQSGAMSEGWGDTDALMVSVRPDDQLLAGNDHWQGAYGLAGYVIDNFYAGIRRVPYTTDMEKNGFTLKHISDGEPTPDGGAGASNSEVHNAGEIWANQMWECYAAILNRHPFAEAQPRMKDIIIAGLKGTTDDATFTEARDAILAAAKAVDDCDYRACANAFAKRGSGPNAVAPARDSTDLTGVEEDFTPYAEACPVSGSSSGGSSSGGSSGTSSGGSSGTSSGGSSGTSGSGSSSGGSSGTSSGSGSSGGDSSGRFGGALGLPLLLSLLGLGLLGRRRRLA